MFGFLADKAKVIYAPQEIYLPYGRPAVLDCHFRSNPPLTNLRWEKDGFLFDPYNVQVWLHIFVCFSSPPPNSLHIFPPHSFSMPLSFFSFFYFPPLHQFLILFHLSLDRNRYLSFSIFASSVKIPVLSKLPKFSIIYRVFSINEMEVSFSMRSMKHTPDAIVVHHIMTWVLKAHHH